jgi:hypothetical protein
MMSGLLHKYPIISANFKRRDPCWWYSEVQRLAHFERVRCRLF